MSALFTDHNRKCVTCGARAGVWPIDDDVATCPTCGAKQEAADLRLRLLDIACRLLRVSDIPRGRKRWYRLTLRLLEARYTTAKNLHGRDYARRYDYVPF